MAKANCKICETELLNSKNDMHKYFFNCSNCGKYFLMDSLNTDIDFFDNRKEDFYKVSSYIYEQNNQFNNQPEIDKERFEELLNMKDKKMQEKFDLMMIYLSKIKDARLNSNKLIIESYLKNDDEFLLFFERSKDYGYIKGSVTHAINGGGAYSYSGLTFEGLEYIESLENINQSSKNIFVAFNFEEDLNEIFNTHLKIAIENEGFNYVVVNQNNVEHNKSINDEIIVKLKSSRIVIADFTNHRNSVYFEAGYAMGMNIPIIWTCQEEHKNEMSFDTRQFPHIIWKDKDDLVKQVIDRIKVII